MSTAPAFPSDAIPLDPPAPYRLWWAMTEFCGGVRGDLAGVQWFVVPGARELSIHRRRYQGFYFPTGKRIVLAEHSIMSPSLVRHEMLHALIESVVVRLSPVAPGRQAAATFGYIAGGMGGYQFVWDTLMRFDGHETRRAVFDLRFAPGRWMVGGHFNSDTLLLLELTMEP